MTIRRLFPLLTSALLAACGDPAPAPAGTQSPADAQAAGDVTAGDGQSGDTGADTAPAPKTGTLRVLTYNVHGLPAAITGDDTAGRMKLIGPLLEPFDVVGLQEDFVDANHATLEQAVTHPHKVRFATLVAEDKFYGSGLAVFSRVPPGLVEQRFYTTCYGLFDHAADCMASKGFQILRLQVAPGVEVDFYNTHMEAGGGPEDQAARIVQVGQVVEAMATVSKDRAVIFVGDTNISVDDPVEAPQMATLTGQAGLHDACEAVKCPQPGRIDRILLRDSAQVDLQVETWTNEPAFVDAKGVPLSDHDAISARIRWTRK